MGSLAPSGEVQQFPYLFDQSHVPLRLLKHETPIDAVMFDHLVATTGDKQRFHHWVVIEQPTGQLPPPDFWHRQRTHCKVNDALVALSLHQHCHRRGRFKNTILVPG